MIFIDDLTWPNWRGRFLKKNCGNTKLERKDRGALGVEYGDGVSPSPPEKGSEKKFWGGGTAPYPEIFFRFSTSNRRILVQTGCFLCSSYKDGLNAVLVRGRPKCQTLAICMLSYGEVRHQYQSISQSEFLAWPEQQATATNTMRWLMVKQLEG